MAIRSSSSSSSSSRASLIVVLLACSVIVSSWAQKTISVTNGASAPQSTWGPVESCPPGSKAVGFDTQNDLTNIAPLADASALNTIRLYCDDADSSNITSTQGFEGTVSRKFTCDDANLGPGFLVSFRLRVVQWNAPNVTDNTAANNVEFTCSNTNVLSGVGNGNGDWGDYSVDDCLAQGGICGIQTRQRPQGGVVVDNSALNDVRFECCQ